MVSSGKPLRILFVNRMASMVRGGGETFDLEIARHLTALGCEVTFLTNIPVWGTAHPSSDLRPPLSVKHIRSPMFPWFPWDKVKMGWRVRVAEFWIFEHLAARWAWNHRHEFDIIQVCELPFFVSAFKSRIPQPPITNPQSPISNNQSPFPRLVMRLTAPDFYDVNGAADRADALIASGDTWQQVHRRRRPDCIDIPNGVDVDQFRMPSAECRRENRKRLGVSDETLVILHVARFQDVKDHKMLIEAFDRMRRQVLNSRLLLAGSGHLQPAVEKQVASLGLSEHVTFLGEVPHEKLPGYYAAADINVVSSFYESFCFAVLEGMASGLPHVVTDTNWVPRLIGDRRSEIDSQSPTTDSQSPISNPQSPISNNQSTITYGPGGLVTPIRDADSFANALLTLANDVPLRKQMGAWNREKAQREHTWDASARKLRALYDHLLQPNPKSPIPNLQ
jgi:glycosyltransferase involved in cell wall biosynthesis